MAAPERAGTDPHSRSTTDLLEDLAGEMSDLVREEVQLARAELVSKSKRMGAGTGLFGAAGAIGLLGAGALVAAAIAGIATVLSVWLAAIVVGGALCLVAGGLALGGLAEISKAAPPVPEEAIQSSKEDVEWLKTQARSARR